MIRQDVPRREHLNNLSPPAFLDAERKGKRERRKKRKLRHDAVEKLLSTVSKWMTDNIKPSHLMLSIAE